MLPKPAFVLQSSWHSSSQFLPATNAAKQSSHAPTKRAYANPASGGKCGNTMRDAEQVGGAYIQWGP